MNANRTARMRPGPLLSSWYSTPWHTHSAAPCKYCQPGAKIANGRGIAAGTRSPGPPARGRRAGARKWPSSGERPRFTNPRRGGVTPQFRCFRRRLAGCECRASSTLRGSRAADGRQSRPTGGTEDAPVPSPHAPLRGIAPTGGRAKGPTGRVARRGWKPSLGRNAARGHPAFRGRRTRSRAADKSPTAEGDESCIPAGVRRLGACRCP
jgi:hypothetical protein